LEERAHSTGTLVDSCLGSGIELRLQPDELRGRLPAERAPHQVSRHRRSFSLFQPTLDKSANRIFVKVIGKRVLQDFSRQTTFETPVDQLANRVGLRF
jgi:hypothetical protein